LDLLKLRFGIETIIENGFDWNFALADRIPENRFVRSIMTFANYTHFGFPCRYARAEILKPGLA